MRRRTIWLARVGFALLAIGALSAAVAAEVPVVLQLGDPSFTLAEQATMAAEITGIDDVLREGYPIPVSRLGGRGWTNADFAIFVRGYMKSSGYEASVVEGNDPSAGHRIWVLVGVALESRTAWVPVVTDPSIVGTSSRLGLIAWDAADQGEFDSSYVSFDRVVEVASHPSPSVKISITGRVVAQTSTPIHALSTASSGIIAYVWTIEGDEAVYVETNAAGFRYTFGTEGERNVTLVVHDRWGGRGVATKEVDVVAEAFDCGCHD